MSRNFELLQRVAKDDVSSRSGKPVLLSQKTSTAIPLKKELPDSEITKLVQRLFSPTTNASGPKVVSFSGIERDDRSSWICARAAETLSEQANSSICVVDGNLWSPQLHVHLSAVNSIGWAQALATRDSIRHFAMPLSRPNLWLIPCGEWKPGMHFSRQSYGERFTELRETFDYILISAPALSREIDATLLGQLGDGVALIVEANHSRRDAVRRAKEQLESAQVRILGAVLDQRTFPIPEKLYRRL
jgi:Mrp family chromosome partitioning ATPase